MLNLFLPLFTVSAQIQEWDQTASGGTSCVVDGVPTLKCLEIVFGNVLFMASSFIVLTLFIMFVVGSFRYLTSFGNAERVKKAQGTLRMALVGFLLFLSAFLILNIIQILFLGKPDPSNPNDTTPNLFKFEIGQ